MTVKELIEKLEKYPENAIVQVWWSTDEECLYKADADGEFSYNKKENTVVIS